jgi:ubiquinone/menaquinone biosynthesis C-methylase UbiE
VASVAGADRVIALDYSLAMLEAVGVRVPRVTRVHGSASTLPFADGVLGGINCSDALQALPDPDAAVREVARTLMVGATFTCFTMLDGPVPYRYFQARFPDHARTRFTVAGLEALVRSAGLELVDLVTVGSGVFFAARKGA